MYTSINGVQLFYREIGHVGIPIILLHGWGQSHAFWADIVQMIPGKYRLYILDLPGFGLSQEPPATWSLHDYADFINVFARKKHIRFPIVIGHSFGGRIAAVYASRYPVAKLVLYSNGGLSQAGIHKKIYRYFFVRIVKHVAPNWVYRSHTTLFKPKQYKNVLILNSKRSRRMLDIYSQPYQNLESALKRITASTLIISGSKDYIVEPRMGERLHAIIVKSRLVEIPDATHFSHLEKPDIFKSSLNDFLDDN